MADAQVCCRQHAPALADARPSHRRGGECGGAQATLIGAWWRMPRETEPCWTPAEAVPLMSPTTIRSACALVASPMSCDPRAPNRAWTTMSTCSSPSSRATFSCMSCSSTRCIPGGFSGAPNHRKRRAGPFLRRPISIRGDYLARSDMPQFADPEERDIGIGSEIRPDKNVQFAPRRAHDSKGAASRTTTSAPATTGGGLRHTAEQRARGGAQSERGDHEQARLPLLRELREHLIRRSGGKVSLRRSRQPPADDDLLVQALDGKKRLSAS